jgi:tetratricopeptide (TPR) repeat protein
MPYVRRRGSQVLIVHGHRDPRTGNVLQRTLFAVYSAEEARNILGPGNRQFRALLREQYPQIQFDWKKIERGIRALADDLPEVYGPANGINFAQGFRDSMAAFARQLVLASPTNFAEGAEALRRFRHELTFLQHVIERDLSVLDSPVVATRKHGQDFYWRFAMYGNEVPQDVEDLASDAYEKGEWDRAEAIFGLLAESFDHYAEGYNFLGCIAHERGNTDQATALFRKAAATGRNLFPKRIARYRYWSDLKTRPYMRALMNLAMSLNEARHYDEALAVCDHLEKECQDELTADSHRAEILLNMGRWTEAAATAHRLSRLDASRDFIAAFAFAESGQWQESLASFLHAALNDPFAARLLAGAACRKPGNSTEADDYNTGVRLLRSLAAYLGERRSRKTRQFFHRVIHHPRIRQLLAEVELRRKRRAEVHPPSREDFDRLTVMQESEFAKEQAQGMTDLLAN